MYLDVELGGGVGTPTQGVIPKKERRQAIFTMEHKANLIYGNDAFDKL